MDINTLLARLGGEILANKARATVDGRNTVLAILDDQTWVWTDEGHALRAEHSNLAASEAAPQELPKKAPRKRAAQPVESLDIDPADFAESE